MSANVNVNVNSVMAMVTMIHGGGQVSVLFFVAVYRWSKKLKEFVFVVAVDGDVDVVVCCCLLQ